MVLISLIGQCFQQPARFVGCVTLSISTLIFTGFSYAETVSFPQAWQQLLQVSDQLQAKNQHVNRAKAEESAGDALNYPSLNVAGSYTRLEKPIELDLQDLNPLASLDVSTLPSAITDVLATIPSSMYVTPFTEQDVFRASLQAMWPIYTGGRITAAQGIHAAQVSESEQEFALASRELFLQLVDRYYAVSVTQTLAETQKQLVDSLSLHASHAEKLEQQGQIAKVERLNAQVALENAKVDWGKAKRQYEMAEIALARMLHVPAVNPTTGLFMLEQQPSLSRLSQLTLTQHPALKLLEAKEAQANGLVDLEKGGYFPTVYLYGNYTLYEDDSLFSQVEPDWMVGVGVSIPLISRDGRSGKVLAAKSALLQARYTKAQTRQDLSLLIDQSYRQMLQAKEEVDALDTSLALATENLRLRELAFNQGLSTSIDRVDAELSLTAVKTKQLGAKYRYMQAYAKVMAVSGQVDEYVNRTQIQGASHAD
ncbi:TolC family protein [Shewanella ulleungensis]|jgi:outer membrane protein TolC|uniref:Transporter n=1 Tax=Shewanella ulleungensis TaxID=2282699 RepID=A0ABQ2QQG9_9GAMM|nr:TolC family protein [Shewanella ulleungensis]MCL1150243.1 TolC family protein [Shewanella ulleungensis]GGP88820.1 transporter [Shewanella ulleungensis]